MSTESDLINTINVLRKDVKYLKAELATARRESHAWEDAANDYKSKYNNLRRKNNGDRISQWVGF